jgi:hypothetical protein
MDHQIHTPTPESASILGGTGFPSGVAILGLEKKIGC